MGKNFEKVCTNCGRFEKKRKTGKDRKCKHCGGKLVMPTKEILAKIKAKKGDTR